MIKLLLVAIIALSLQANSFTDLKKSLEDKVACIKCKQCNLRTANYLSKHRESINSGVNKRDVAYGKLLEYREKLCECNTNE